MAVVYGQIDVYVTWVATVWLVWRSSYERRTLGRQPCKVVMAGFAGRDN
jgi:hypothetical protein